MIALLLSLTLAAAPEPARASDDFVESVGINTHLDFTETPYAQQFDAVKSAILAAGFRHFRTAQLGSFDPQSGAFTPAPRVAALVQAGLRANFLADLNSGTPSNAQQLVKAFLALYPGGVSSVEGPNEPDFFWDSNGYQGQPYPQGAIAFQRDLYAAMKADPATASVPVFGIALGLAGGPPCSNDNVLGNAGELEASVDFGNSHPYPAGNPFHPDFDYDFLHEYYHNNLLPSAMLDPSPVPGLTGWDDAACMARKPYGAKPMVATETGIALFDGGIPEYHLAALMPRILLENFRLGIRRSFLYELLDTNVPAGAYGLLRGDLTPRPSYPSVQTLLRRLSDPGPAFQPDALDYTLDVSPVTLTPQVAQQTFDKLSYVHHLLFQKRDGRFELILWHEIATDGYDGSNHVDLSPPALPALLTVNQRFASATLTTVDGSGGASTTPVDPSQPIGLSINERFQVLELVPETPPPSSPVDAGVPDVPGVPGGPILHPITTVSGWTCQSAGGVVMLPTLLLVVAALGRGRRYAGR